MWFCNSHDFSNPITIWMSHILYDRAQQSRAWSTGWRLQRKKRSTGFNILSNIVLFWNLYLVNPIALLCSLWMSNFSYQKVEGMAYNMNDEVHTKLFRISWWGWGQSWWYLQLCSLLVIMVMMEVGTKFSWEPEVGDHDHLNIADE